MTAHGIQVKVCGLTRLVDVEAAVRLGANALGFVFAPSPRHLTAVRAARLTQAVPPGIMRVGLFMDPAPEAVREILESVPLDLLQFHGSETNDFCRAFERPFIKAIAMQDTQFQRRAEAYPDARGLLLDAHRPGGAGGTGQVFNWRLKPETGLPLWLAGGLDPDNVAAAIAAMRPYAVDVSSGVESAPGIKDEQLIEAFIRRARQA